ncbi:MAG TPA: papain-like cysteine protease family protein [Pyrinomonadaceae bacterium]|jgi:hypothetical protein|nr:papain-like cysteine protease family protein [Pyrinomonadaceae bacterium]
MPLTVNNGTSLSPQPPEAPAEEKREVDITHRPQEGRLWCWAACVQMVLEHNNTQMSQCEIVQTKLDDPDHVCVQDPNLRNESCEVTQMARTWRKCGVKQVKPIDFEITIEDIKAEIAADRPIQVGILWDEDEGGGGHVILINGWVPGPPEALLIDDPLRKSSVGESQFTSGLATHDDVMDALGHGTWRYTWTHLEKTTE